MSADQEAQGDDVLGLGPAPVLGAAMFGFDQDDPVFARATATFNPDGSLTRHWDDGTTDVSPVPTPELVAAITGEEPEVLDAQDVVAALSDALELAEVWLVDGGTGTIDDRLALYAILRDWQKRGGRLATIVADVEQSVVGDLDTPRQVDGQWWRAKRKATRNGYDKDGLRSAINREAFAPRKSVDPLSGEILGDRTPTTAEVVDTIWQAADVAVSRTKVLRETFGIDLDEYAKTNWSTVLEPVDFADLTPEQQAEGITT